MALSDILGDVLDPVEDFLDPEADDYYAGKVKKLPKSERYSPKAPTEAKRSALQELLPQDQRADKRFIQGAFSDVSEISSGLISVAGLPFSPMGRETIARGAKAVYDDPIGAAGTIAQAFVEPYQRREGEDWGDVIARRLLDDPLSTAMDAAGLVSGVGLAAKGLAIAGRAPKLYEAGSAIVKAAENLDPIMGLWKGGQKIGRTVSPAWGQTQIVKQEAKHLQQAQRQAEQFANWTRDESIAGLKKRMAPEEAGLFYSVIQGKMPLEAAAAAMAKQLGDLPEVAAQRMAQHVSDYAVIQGGWEQAANMAPEQIAIDKVKNSWLKMTKGGAEFEEARLRNFDDLIDPKQREELGQIYQQAFDEAASQRDIRRSMPIRDVIYDARAKSWNKSVQKTRLENKLAGLVDESQWLDPVPELPRLNPDTLTLDDVTPWQKSIMENLSPQDIHEQGVTLERGRGAFADAPGKGNNLKGLHREGDSLGLQPILYAPHSMEILTSTQATFGNILGKMKEAVPWKFNKMAMSRAGMLDILEPHARIAKATESLRTAVAKGDKKAAKLAKAEIQHAADPVFEALMRADEDVTRKLSSINIYESLAQKFGEKVDNDTVLTADKRLTGSTVLRNGRSEKIEATHQLMWPNGRMQMYALSHELEPFLKGLMQHVDDPVIRDSNAIEIISKAAAKMDSTIAVKRGDMYRIPKELGDVIHEMVQARSPSTSAVNKLIDKGSDLWRFSTLNLRPAWVANNFFGNAIFNAMYGMHVLNPAAYTSYFDAFRAWGVRYHDWDKKFPTLFGEESRKLADIYDMPGIGGGGFVGGEQTMFREGAHAGTNVAAKALNSRFGPVRGVGVLAEGITALNEGVESFFRAGAAIYGLKKYQKAQMIAAGENVLKAMHVGDRIQAIKAAGIQGATRADYQSAMGFTNKALNDYANQTAFQRRTLRRIMPFQAFYLHALKTGLHWPFEKGAQATLLRTLAKVVRQDLKDQAELLGFDLDKEPAPWMDDSIPMRVIDGPNGEKLLQMLSTKGANPLSILSMRDPGAEAFSNINPIHKVLIETVTGVDLFRWEKTRGPMTTFGGQTTDPETGRLVEDAQRKNPIENFARQFWPYELAEQAIAQGRIRNDTTDLVDLIFNQDEAYKKDPDTGKQIRRPFRGTDLLKRPIVGAPQYVQHPSDSQLSAEKGAISEQFNKLWRKAKTPEERAELTATLRRHQAKTAGQPKRQTRALR